METAGWGKKSALATLLREPQCFDFFQAVRLIERYCYDFLQGKIKNFGDLEEVLLAHEIKLQVSTKSAFPVGLIDSIEVGASAANSVPMFFRIIVNFMGLTGPNGVMPYHYHELLALDPGVSKGGLRDFFGIFNHRILSLLYSIWGKHNLLVNYEKTKVYQINNAPFDKVLNSLLGIKDAASNRQPNIQQVLQLYGGVFANKYRPAGTLENILNEYFELPIKILQFQGRWLELNSDEYSKIGNPANGEQNNQQIGVNFILGKRCWDIQNKFRIYIGPVNSQQFNRLKPKGRLMQTLLEITRFYVGIEFDFDVQIELLAEDLERGQLSSKKALQLGWNGWLVNKSLKGRVSDVVIRVNN